MKNFLGSELKRMDNPMFWVTSVSQLLIVVQVVLAIFGKQTLITDALKNNIMDAVEVLVAFLGTVGVFTTPINFPIVAPTAPAAPAEPVVSPAEPVVAPAEPVVAPVEDVEPTSSPVEPAAPVEPAKVEESSSPIE